ncbi:Crp/Fnr family transcriptional regulator [Sphingomonas nostoxanthinifaciens]|nr:Crp/Fnr family transcriptional regulator [Sphingomonas nostoxanthinifaciens]
MSRLLEAEFGTEPAFRRLSALTALDEPARTALQRAMNRARMVAARRDVLAEGAEINETLLVLDGWAARFRQLEDGRRQIIGLLLPGDLIGLCDQERPLASCSIVAITDLQLCVAPDRAASPTLARAYALSRALDEVHLIGHITRLGRLDAHERMIDLMLELLERMDLAGLTEGGQYALPLTQEVLADLLGLTAVHVNRTLQAMRRAGDIASHGRALAIANPPALYRRIARTSPRVSALERSATGRLNFMGGLT